MAGVSTELESLLNWPPFRDYHDTPDGKGADFERELRRFFASTMDEVRTSVSGRIANHILGLIGISGSGLFRVAVLRRELTGTIAYDRQRDHSAHTVYNYLLGWYFYRYCEQFKRALSAAFQIRGVGRPEPVPFSSEEKYFGCVWQYVSLLHDIGYMFEGGLKSLELRESRLQAALGSDAAREYFNREFWLEHGLELAPARESLFKALGEDLRPPRFDHSSTLGEIADQLRFVGNDLDALGVHVRESLRQLSVPSERGPELNDFSGDAFDLWAHHYERFGSVEMAARVRSLRKVFNGLIDKGLTGPGIRLLDHGVCSGLLQLLASTYYYRIYAAGTSAPDPKPAIVKVFLRGLWSPAFWWTGIVWGTAAAAIHNVQQQTEAQKLDPNWPGRLKLDDDPLAYLGVVVDTIEEWDRYSVFKGLDREPVQGSEVTLENCAGRIVVTFVGPNGEKHAKKRRDELTASLDNWDALLSIAP